MGILTSKLIALYRVGCHKPFASFPSLVLRQSSTISSPRSRLRQEGALITCTMARGSATHQWFGPILLTTARELQSKISLSYASPNSLQFLIVGRERDRRLQTTIVWKTNLIPIKHWPASATLIVAQEPDRGCKPTPPANHLHQGCKSPMQTPPTPDLHMSGHDKLTCNWSLSISHWWPQLLAVHSTIGPSLVELPHLLFSMP